MKRIDIQKKARPFSLPATIGFLLLSAGFVVGCVLIVGSMLGRHTRKLPEAEIAATPSAAPQEEVSSEAAALLIPEQGRLPSPTPTLLPSESPAPAAPSVAPSPTPTPMPPIGIPAFTENQMDFVVLGFDADGSADVLCIVSLRGDRCAVLSMPRNTLADGGAVLGAATSASHAFTGMRSVFPVYLRYYIQMDMQGLADCVDAFGGVSIDGVQKTGAQVMDYLEAGGSDELLRITRQQTLLHAMAARLQQLGLLRLLSAKYTLQKHTVSNLSASQYFELYGALRRIDADDIRFLTLPVDSVIQSGKRFYQADRQLCEALARELFQNAS